MYRKLKDVNYFGIRHLSPVSAYCLEEFLNEVSPKVVLIEGLEDASDLIPYMLNAKNTFPISILGYNKLQKEEVLFLPFASYSPEYRAMKWSQDNNALCEFIDLPLKDVFKYSPSFKKDLDAVDDLEDQESLNSRDNYKYRVNHMYDYIAWNHGESDYDIYWESEFEQIQKTEKYISRMNIESSLMREYLENIEKELNPESYEYNIRRERNMQKNILKYLNLGYKSEDIVVVCGAYHTEGLKNYNDYKEDKGECSNDNYELSLTVIPYSYQNLSRQSGYGAGNIAPSYYELLWEDRKNNENLREIKYLASLAKFLREDGVLVSTDAILEGVKLSKALAFIRNRNHPTLKELYDSALTTQVESKKQFLDYNIRKVNISNVIGHVEETNNISSIQDDFYQNIEALKLSKYLVSEISEIKLDLREDYKKQTNRFLGLKRSIFFTMLSILKISFCELQESSRIQNNFEVWNVQWTPKVEVELISAIMKGHTIEEATRDEIQRKLIKVKSILDVVEVIDYSYKCQLLDVVDESFLILEDFLIDNDNFEDSVVALMKFTRIYNYKTTRNIDSYKVGNIISRLYKKSCLLLNKIGEYSNDEIETFLDYIVEIYNITKKFKKLINGTFLYTNLKKLVYSSSTSSMISGIALNILIKEKILEEEKLIEEIKFRLSTNTQKEELKDWIYGLFRINRMIIIENKDFWILINEYIENLNYEQFIKILVPLRRAFSFFESQEKNLLFENLSKILNIEEIEIAHEVEQIKEEDKQLLEKLNDFDFGDLI